MIGDTIQARLNNGKTVRGYEHLTAWSGDIVLVSSPIMVSDDSYTTVFLRARNEIQLKNQPITMVKRHTMTLLRSRMLLLERIRRVII